MGYMGLGTWVESDMAADMVYEVYEVVVKKLKKQINKKENSFNTDGIENVGLFLIEVNV